MPETPDQRPEAAAEAVRLDADALQRQIEETDHHAHCAQRGLDVLVDLAPVDTLFHSGDIEYGLMVALRQVLARLEAAEAALDAVTDMLRRVWYVAHERAGHHRSLENCNASICYDARHLLAATHPRRVLDAGNGGG